MITIVDYGLGNLGSIANMFKKIGVIPKISSDFETIKKAEKIVLPGVGAFDSAMKRINSNGFKEVLDFKALEQKVPFLGICLGMQLLTNGSEEGKLAGLGYINANTLKFKFVQGSVLKVPHMGWNEVTISNPSKLTAGIEELSVYDEKPRFYFVHSYYVKVANEQNSMLKTHYYIDFDSAILQDNIYGAQFHPEKSHKFGMKVLENFAKL